MPVLRRVETKKLLESDLAPRRWNEVVSAGHLIDAGIGVVDHDRELVSGHPISPDNDKVVDATSPPAGDAIHEGDLLIIGLQTPRGAPTVALQTRPLVAGQVSAGPRIRVGRRRPVGCGSRGLDLLPDLPPGAVTGVEQISIAELSDHFKMSVEPGALSNRFVITAHPNAGEIVKLTGLIGLGSRDVIEVLHSQQETAST